MSAFKGIIAILLFGLQIASGYAADERIWIEGAINGKPAHFIFDTGSPSYILFRNGAERLGIAVTNFPAGDAVNPTNGVFVGYTGDCLVNIRGTVLTTMFMVIDSPPPYLDMSADGFFGWPSVTNTVVMIDAIADTMEQFKSVPMDVTDWTKIPVQTGANYFRLVVPELGGKKAVVVVDTGSPMGVKLRPDLWRAWRAAHTNQPVAMNANFMWGAGITYSEELWAKEISLGSLSLTEVPVTMAGADDLEIGAQDYEATLGLAALKRFDLIVDAVHGVAYLRAKKDLPPPYKHSRIGAAFVPPNPQSTLWIAHVFKNGPAYLAGIRDGDILLKVDGAEIETAQDYVRLGERMKDTPSGTKVALTLKRGTNIVETSIVLKDIIGPTQGGPKNSKPAP